jgi:hypothetical protein
MSRLTILTDAIRRTFCIGPTFLTSAVEGIKEVITLLINKISTA